MALAPPFSLHPWWARPTVVVLARVRAWPVESQQRARRNAMLAATDCAQRRAEREAVEDFLDARAHPVAPARPAGAAQG